MSNWSWPAGQNGDGFVFMGMYPCTEDDFQGLFDYLTSSPESTWETLEDMWRAGVHVDRLSLVGKYHPDWSSAWQKVKSGSPQGGVGSTTYEKQRCGAGVKFTRKAVWCYPDYESNELDRVVPSNYAYHYSEQRGTNVMGPEPGSEAERLLGDGTYVWNEERAMWEIEGGEMLPLPPEPEYTECPHCMIRLQDFLKKVG